MSADAVKLETLTIRQLLQLQVQLLCDIREGLIADAVEDEGCQHPEDRRISLSSFGDLDHWVCGVCKFDNKKDATMN